MFHLTPKFVNLKKGCIANKLYLKICDYLHITASFGDRNERIMLFPFKICTQFQPILWYGYSSTVILLADLDDVSLDNLLCHELLRQNIQRTCPNFCYFVLTHS